MRKARETAITCGSRSTVAVALLLALTGVAFAHGGVYRGPDGRVPPDRREPYDAPPPPGRGTAPKNVRGTVAGFADWSFWWERHRDRVLGAAVAGRADGLDRDEVRRWVVPALRHLLRGKTVNFDVSSAAALALARIGDRESSDFLLQCMANPGKNVHRVLEETSALALGILDDGDAGTTDALRAVLADPERDSSFVRPFAALALAVRERDDVSRVTAEALIAAIPREQRRVDARPAALAALGVLGDARCSSALAAPAFGEDEVPDHARLRDQDRAAAVAAHGVHGDPECAVDGLLGCLGGDASHVLRREAVLALGGAAARANNPSFARPALERLIGMLGPGGDAGRAVEPEHVIQAIGRTAASTDDVGGAARAFLEGALRTEERPSVRANAAVCLGLAARARGTDGGGALAALRGLFSRTEEPQERAAYALALGLVGDHEAVPALRPIVADAEADDALRGYAALALGLLGSGEAEIVALAGPENGHESRVQAYLALGLLGGPEARRASLAALRPSSREESWFVMGAAAWALGANPDMDAIAELVATAQELDGPAADLTRALAVAAVGRACARPDVPTLDAVRDALPYRVLTPAFLELLTIL